MIIEGESLIAAPRAQVWQALNDPEALRQSIPGCEALEMTGENSFATRVRASVGPISATFDATVTLTDIAPERGYTIVGEGKGGAAGFARGQARVDLEDGEHGSTLLRYKADVKVGGKLAQIGSRLIQGTAKKLSEQFFDSFGALLNESAAPEADAPQDASAPHSASAVSGRRWIWGAGLVIVIALLLWWIQG